MIQIEPSWKYGQVKSNALNVRREPNRKARRWNNVWPMNRIVLVKPSSVTGWYETLYRGESAYVMANYIEVLEEPVPASIVERMLFMAEPERNRNKSIYFNGYGGEWCHRFADWLPMNAGMPKDKLPDTSNCGKGIVWFSTNQSSGGFYFKNQEHKTRMLRSYPALSALAQALTDDELAYHPLPGDYIYFRWRKATTTANVSHVGIVASVEKNTVTTWEGNASRKVAPRIYFLDSSEIVGYGHPTYNAL